MSDLRTNLILNLTGNLPGQSRRFGRDVEMIGQRGARSIAMMNRGLAAAGRGLDRMGNRYTAFLFGGGGIATMRMIGNLEQRFTRLGIQANMGAEEIDKLKRRIFEVSQAPDIRIDPNQLTAAVEEIVEKTGDLKFAEDNLRNLAAAIQATGAEGLSIGGIAAEFQKMGLIDPGDVLKALDILDVQGKKGAFTLQNLAALGPRVVTAYTAMGRTGLPAIREMGAALQVIRQGTGSSEMAATAFEALLRTLGDAQKVKLLTRGGIKLFDPDALKQGKQILRPINELMVEIIQRTKGRKTLLSTVFDAEAIRAFNSAASEFQRTGSVASLDQFYNVQADGSTVLADSARAAKDFNSALTYLYTSYRKFADSELAGPVTRLADTLNSLEPGTVDRWMQIAKWIGVIGAGAIGARMLYRGGCGALGMFRSQGNGGAGGASGIPGIGAGVVPVYVVNRQMSLLNDGSGFGGAPASGGKSGTAAGKGAGLAGNLLKYGTVLGLEYLAFETITDLARTQVDRRLSGQDMESMAGIMNKWAKLGATHMYEYRQAESSLRDAEMRGELKITIDQRGFVTVDKINGKNLDIDVDTGRLMPSH